MHYRQDRLCPVGPEGPTHPVRSVTDGAVAQRIPHVAVMSAGSDMAPDIAEVERHSLRISGLAEMAS